jgi:two-component system chemotaxis response regulator CheB
MGVSDVLTAFNGKEALNILKENKPDMITLDINMPVMAGDVTLKHIMIKSPSPVILITGVSGNNISKVMEFMRLGALDFIPKPNDSLGWEIVNSRLEKIFKNLQSLELKNLRRAKMPRLRPKKQKPVHPAQKCLVIMGGLGGILETQKILGSLSDNGSLSIICFIDMVKELTVPLSSYMDSFSLYTISQIMDGGPLLASQCQIASMDEAWKVSHGHVPSMQLHAGGKALNVNEFLSSAADIFGFNFMIFLLSGMDFNMKAGLDSVLHKGGRIFIQRPDNALAPETLKRLMVHEMEEACIEPEELSELVHEWMNKEEEVIGENSYSG